MSEEPGLGDSAFYKAVSHFVFLQNLLLRHSSNRFSEAQMGESCKYGNNSIRAEARHGGTDQLFLLVTPIVLNADHCSRPRRSRLDTGGKSCVMDIWGVGFMSTNLYFNGCYIYQAPLYNPSRKLSSLPVFLTTFQWN